MARIVGEKERRKEKKKEKKKEEEGRREGNVRGGQTGALPISTETIALRKRGSRLESSPVSP